MFSTIYPEKSTAKFIFNGTDWSAFQNEWNSKLNKVAVASMRFSFSEDAVAWVDWTRSHGISEAEYDSLYSKLCEVSQFTLLAKVLKKYDEQFEILLDGAETYDEFKDVVNFLQDYPLELLTDVGDIASLEKVQEYVLPTIENIFGGILAYKEEKTYKALNEDEGINLHLSYFSRRWNNWGYLQWRNTKSLYGQFH